MSVVDKNQAIIDYLNTFEYFAKNSMFFNFSKIEEGNTQITTVTTDEALNKPYVDGSVLKRYTFTIIDYKSIAYNAIIKREGYTDENLEDMLDVQSIIDWIDEQNDNFNFPDFGEKCEIQSIKALTDMPKLNGVDVTINPPIAKYSVTIKVEYIDTSKCICY